MYASGDTFPVEKGKAQSRSLDGRQHKIVKPFLLYFAVVHHCSAVIGMSLFPSAKAFPLDVLWKASE
jgi:hypothetical protein